MKKLVFALAITTVTFASTTVYFAHALNVERQRSPQPTAIKLARLPVATPSEASSQSKPASSRTAGQITMAGEIQFIEVAGAADSSERQLDSAVDFSRRLRDRAAALLNPKQLAVFNEMQDEALAQLRERLHTEDVVNSVRQSGSR